MQRVERPPRGGGETPARIEDTELLVVLFDDMQASTALKHTMTKRSDEQSFQELRKAHDALLGDIVARDGAGEVIKSTGDGHIAVFRTPSLAVERAIEVQEALHAHPHLRVRMGMDMGEVRVERVSGRIVDVFGAHVDWAARTMALADGGHICVTGAVYRDAFSWITKSRIAWKHHGPYRVKAGEPPLDVYQPYNANHHRPMRKLRGEKVVTETKREQQARPEPPPSEPAPAVPPDLGMELIRPWEAVARDGRNFAEKGAGTMYWFKVPLGGLSYPEGFRHFLQPALENDRIGKIRFVLDGTNPSVREIWTHIVMPLTRGWAEAVGRTIQADEEEDRGSFSFDGARTKHLGWVFVDLANEFTPCFKLFVEDPDSDEVEESGAQIFLSTAQRMVRLPDGAQRTIRIPDAVLRVHPGRHEALLHALNAVANQWDSLF